MDRIFKQIPLYRFLSCCNNEHLEKTVLDCGAGGDCPPLSLFKSYGYETKGIELDDDQLKKAEKFASENDQILNIAKGDMRKLAFDDGAFSFVYSYNSVFHMKKTDVAAAVAEMKRVLKPQGLIFLNFLSVSDFRCGTGGDLTNNQYRQIDDKPVIHSYYEETEPDIFFKDMQVLYKETRAIERIYEGEKVRQGFIDYIAKKI